MLSKTKIRCVTAVAIVGGSLAFAAPGIAAAAPLDLGSSTGSSAIDDPIGTLQAGSSALDDPIGVGTEIIGNLLDSVGLGSSGPVATQNCNESTQAGGTGVTDTIHVLGRPGPTSFVLDYETENIPDEIEVFYQGGRIYTTGVIGDNLNEGTGSAVVNVPPGVDSTVVVRVTGPDGTEWGYTVHC